MEKRVEGLNNIDREKLFRRLNENLEVLDIYKKYLDYLLSYKVYELFYIVYFVRLKKNNND